jgi:hypothetical protein
MNVENQAARNRKLATFHAGRSSPECQRRRSAVSTERADRDLSHYPRGLQRLPVSGPWIGANCRTLRAPKPEHSCCAEVQIESPIRRVLLCVAPNGELIIRRIGFNLGDGQCRMVVIQFPPGDEVPDNPASSVLVVVKIDQTVVGDDLGQAQNDTVVAAAPVVIVVRVDRHIPMLVWQTAVPGAMPTSRS